jgi:beta-1,4-glucosyltransferase
MAIVTLTPHAVDTVPGRFVNALMEAERLRAAEFSPVRVTWLNHYSIRLALEDVQALSKMDVCGIDGQFLKWLIRHPVRTSADLVVPILLACDDTIKTVLAIGGTGDRAAALQDALSECAQRPVRVHSLDGFDGLLRGEDLRRFVADIAPDLVLVGLGAGLQEKILLEASSAMTSGYALTCGGFLDQVLQEGYYPPWAYPLRLNWLVRLAREPRRLWRRYTVGALSAVAQRGVWRAAMLAVPGLLAHSRMCELPDLPGPGVRAGG